MLFKMDWEIAGEEINNAIIADETERGRHRFVRVLLFCIAGIAVSSLVIVLAYSGIAPLFTEISALLVPAAISIEIISLLSLITVINNNKKRRRYLDGQKYLCFAVCLEKGLLSQQGLNSQNIMVLELPDGSAIRRSVTKKTFAETDIGGSVAFASSRPVKYHINILYDYCLAALSADKSETAETVSAGV